MLLSKTPITIGVDGNDANVEKKVGVSVYTYELLLYFKRHATSDVRFIIYLRDTPRDDLPKESSYFTYQVVSGTFLWSKIFLPLRLFSTRKLSVFFSPAHYTPAYCPCPIVVTIHDLAYMYYPDEFLKKDLYKLTNWTRESIRKSKSVIAVSQSTKKDIVRWYNTPEKKVAVVHNGFRERKSDKKFSHPLDEKAYFLFVSTIQPRKNLSGLIDAFSIVATEFKDISLVIIGKKGWLYEELEKKAEASGIKDRILWKGYVPDSEIDAWYAHATAYVFPSLYEGFGITILEAMNNGCPVITSNNSSLPEVGGDACIYIDPQNTEEIAAAMIQLKQDRKKRQDLIQRGFKNMKRFSWKRCAEETLDTIISTI